LTTTNHVQIAPRFLSASSLPPFPVAKRKTLFDDRPVEISELTYIIRQDISSLNSQIAQLQSFVRSSSAGKSGAGGGGGGGGTGKKGVVDEHHSNVVMLLQSRLANMGIGFKDVLELRTQVGGQGSGSSSFHVSWSLIFDRFGKTLHPAFFTLSTTLPHCERATTPLSRLLLRHPPPATRHPPLSLLLPHPHATTNKNTDHLRT
jgi:syntaxin 5